MTGTNAKNKKLTWPSSLKTALKIHLKVIQTEGKMPLIEENPSNSVLTIISKVQDSFAPRTEQTKVKVEGDTAPASSAKVTLSSPYSDRSCELTTDTVATLADFLLDLFEQCCLCNLLSVEERRTFQFVVLGKLNASGSGRQQKKRRVEDTSQVPLRQRLTYGSVLTVEYLLRLLASLPTLVHHYQVLCSGIVSPQASSSASTNSDGCEPLWIFANSILRYLELHPTIMTPLARYAPYIDE